MRKFLGMVAIAGLVVPRPQALDKTPFLNGLTTGSHPVGFRSFWVHDGTRTWRPLFDDSGRRLPSSPLRPVRINVWYPAAATQTRVMKFGEYLGSARIAGFAEDEERVRTADLGTANRGLRGLFRSVDSFNALISTPTLAHRNVRAARGQFPIIVYSLGQGDYTQENTPLSEYLASRGYIVVSVPGLGTSPRRSVMFVHDEPSYDNQVRDLALALATIISRFPSADSNRIAAMGHSMGGVYALMLAMRDSRIRTVVGLDPSFVAQRPSYFYRYQDAPEYDAGNFRGNLLAIHKKDDSDRSIIDSLRFADRTLITVDSAIHADFNGFPAYSSRAIVGERDTFALARRPQSTAIATFNGVARYVTCFLDERLGNALVSRTACTPIQRSVTEHIARMDGPTEEELYGIMKTGGITRARALVAVLESRSSRPGLRRSAMQKIVNELGYMNDSVGSENYASLMDQAFLPRK